MIRRAWLKLSIFITLLLNSKTSDEILPELKPYCEIIRLYPKKLHPSPNTALRYAKYYTIAPNSLKLPSILIFSKEKESENKILLDNAYRFSDNKYCYIGKYEDYSCYVWSNIKLGEEYE